MHPYVEARVDKAAVYAIAGTLGLEDLARLPAQPCLASRVETGIAIDRDDLAFVDQVEGRLVEALGDGAVVRCRVTHAGVVIETGRLDAEALAIAREVGASTCTQAGRAFAGVRPYRRGAAFLVGTANG